MPYVNFKTIEEALSQPTSKHFWVKVDGENAETGISESFFSKNIFDDAISFDITNNVILINCSLNGSIKALTMYRGFYSTQNSPGVWWMKDYTSIGPYSLSIKLDEELYKLDEVKWPFRTSLLDNIFPVTELTGDRIKVTLISFSPISEDGKQRIRAAIHGALIENTTKEKIKGSIILPDYYIPKDNPEKWGMIYASFIGCRKNQLEVPFELDPGQKFWAVAAFTVPGETFPDEVNHMGILYWLNSTWSYFKSLTGTLTMPDDEYMAEFYRRMVYQAIGCINMDKDGNPIGSSCGTNSRDGYILMKDTYYYYMPFYMFDTEFFKKGLLWSLDITIRPEGRIIPMIIGSIPSKVGKETVTKGGVTHSLTISLMPVIMSGLYYQSTGDKEFFINNPHIKERCVDIMEQVIQSRENDDIWLFPSDYISDFPAYGDYHTGSNMTAWYSFKSFARILEEVYGNTAKADEYQIIAERLKHDLESRNIIDGPFGKQYIEGVDADGSIPFMGHEAEECDTNLMPFYGYVDYDNTAFKNYTRFALSGYNYFYVPVLKGISPGYPTYGFAISGHITGFANVADRETMNGENGYMTELRKYADVDGSLPWWPYCMDQEQYGKVKRTDEKVPINGKSGYSSGVFTALFVSSILGVKYDGPARTLSFRPFSPSSGFSWEDFKFGNSVFSVSYSRNDSEVIVSVANKNDYDVKLNLEVILNNDTKVNNIYINGNITDIPYEKGKFLNKPTIKLTNKVPAGEIKIISVCNNQE